MAKKPYKYNEDTVEKAREYINSCVDTKEKVNLPTSEGLALHLGVKRKTLYNWSDEYEEFSEVLEELNQTQVTKLINNGLSGRYNSNIAKLVLAKHGYKEQLGLSGEGEGEPIKVNADIRSTIDKIYGTSDSGSA